jgi:topoisomerase-4 subunit A
LKKLKFDIDFSELAIKGRLSKGNIVSKFPLRKVELREKGISTLAARKIWFDDTVQRLNADGRGQFVGSFKGEDKILTVYQSGHYRLTNFDLSTHFDEDLILIERWKTEQPMSVIYWEGEKKRFYVKRFLLELSDKKELFISESPGSYMELATTNEKPTVEINFKKVKGVEKEAEQIELNEFISVKGWKALGNQLTASPVKEINLLIAEVEDVEEEELEESIENINDNEDDDNDGQSQITLEF